MHSRLAATARRQYGVVGHHQAVALGVSEAVIRHRLTAGDWVRVQPRAYVAASTRLEDLGRLFAVWLSVGAPMALTGVAAGLLYKLGALPPLRAIDVVLPVNRSANGLRGVRLRQPAALPVVRHVQGLPVPPLADVLLDIASTVDAECLTNVVQEVLRERRCTEVALRAVMTRGRRGSAALRKVIAIVGDGADSHWERRLWSACAAAGLPKPTRPWLVSPRTGRRMQPDGLIDGVAVEVDGWAVHKTGAAFVDDRRRRNAIVVDLGLDQLNFTPIDLRDRMGECVEEIRLMVLRRQRRSG